MIKQMLIYLFLITCLMSAVTQASELFNHTAVNESQYEDSNSGWLEVSAQLFNAPCHLQVTVSTMMLTQCGAGGGFAENKTEQTPAQIRFYDVENGHVIAMENVRLLNGNNAIQPPKAVNKVKLLRLEVRYE